MILPRESAAIVTSAPALGNRRRNMVHKEARNATDGFQVRSSRANTDALAELRIGINGVRALNSRRRRNKKLLLAEVKSLRAELVIAKA